MKKLFLALIRLYWVLPLASHSACRFTPTCSHYTYQAIDKYGILRGSLLGLKRILRCHPGTPAGPDPLF
ncbi:MAG: membrane protein insertion efficiency factor YidD [Patescibacteria group bacterium]